MPHQLQSTIGDNFVGIHIGSSSGTSLNHVNGELVVMFACQYLFASLPDTCKLRIGQQAQPVVGDSRR